MAGLGAVGVLGIFSASAPPGPRGAGCLPEQRPGCFSSPLLPALLLQPSSPGLKKNSLFFSVKTLFSHIWGSEPFPSHPRRGASPAHLCAATVLEGLQGFLTPQPRSSQPSPQCQAFLSPSHPLPHPPAQPRGSPSFLGRGIWGVCGRWWDPAPSCRASRTSRSPTTSGSAQSSTGNRPGCSFCLCPG